MWLIYSLLIGLVAGYLASRLMGVDSSNIIKNIVLGIIGSFVGGLVGSLISLKATGLIGSIILAVIGSCISIWVYQKFLRKN
ncbi:MAG: GlsB/YeaQ/YmgE family stress response membrane protein [Solobacterium sp.]|nr:GlsB/YeaQ/YmgE family stress response membrane protein [Solobacterium sp.]MBR2794724.1 GlsB/YeaQ/YmgE family stress response membrane protein [Solobacterium sp.]